LISRAQYQATAGQPGERFPFAPIVEVFPVTPVSARILLTIVLCALSFGLLAPPPPGGRAANSAGDYDVYLAGVVPDEALLILSAATVARHPPAVLLIDSPESRSNTRAFLAASNPRRVLPVGRFDESWTALERRLDVRLAAPAPWEGETYRDVQRLYRPVTQAVVCPSQPREQLLQATCLAGTLGARLIVASDGSQSLFPDDRAETRGVKEFIVVGKELSAADAPAGCSVEVLPDASAVSELRDKLLAVNGRIGTVVVANSADTASTLGGMSTLAPIVALRKNAPLLLTNKSGDNAEIVVREATAREYLKDVDSIILVANLSAVPMARRPNPLPQDKDPVIEMEPLTPTGVEPFSFAVGRLFHEDRAVVPLLLARQALLSRSSGPRRALIASNPRGDLNLLEAFSRNTVHELRNAGYETTALFGKEVNGADLRRLMPEHDVFLWEGHHNSLIVDFGLPRWDEPLPPALVFLQSCLALKESKAGPLLSRGAVGVVGSSTRTYSASGGACSLAFFDALLYDGETLGGALRQSKNFLLAYSLLKEKRLGKDATRTGANLRSAWAFTLWGDPTLQLPRPSAPADALPPVRHEVQGNTIVVHLPAEKHERVTSDKYRAEMMPNARLAGLLRKEKGVDGVALAPFVFAEVHLTDSEPGRTPRLHSKVPADRYVFCWDSRRNCGYLLVTPGQRAERELRFEVEWRTPEPQKAETVPTSGRSVTQATSPVGAAGR
jgi:hypothetical protein